MSEYLKFFYIGVTYMLVKKSSDATFVHCCDEDELKHFICLIVLEVFGVLFLVFKAYFVFGPVLPSGTMGSDPGFVGGMNLTVETVL